MPPAKGWAGSPPVFLRRSVTDILPNWYTQPDRPTAISRRGPDGRAVRISVIVPCRNEGRNIRPVLEWAAPYADELLVVDGHSSDDTRNIAAELGATILLDNGKGKGDACASASPTPAVISSFLSTPTAPMIPGISRHSSSRLSTAAPITYPARACWEGATSCTPPSISSCVSSAAR